MIQHCWLRIHKLPCCAARRLCAAVQASNTVAYSLREAMAMPSSVTQLQLHASEALLCNNLMCEKLGEACVCKLARAVMSMPALQVLDLDRNPLTMLPDVVWAIPGLHTLSAQEGRLTELSPSVAQAQHLHTLRLRGNALAAIPWNELLDLPALRLVDLRDQQADCLTGPSDRALADRLHASLQSRGGALLL